MTRKDIQQQKAVQTMEKESFSISKFDCTPKLTEKELTFLALWINDTNSRLPLDTRESNNVLRRLLDPIEYVMTYCGYKNEFLKRRDLQNMFIREMHKRQKTYWAWTANEWLEILGSTTEDFKIYHHNPTRNFRHGLLVCAYLLSKSNVFDNVKGYHYVNFACRIFGTPIVHKAIDTIIDEIKKIGMGTYLTVRHMPSVISEALLLNRNPKLESLSLATLKRVRQKSEPQTDLWKACRPVSQVLHNLRIISNPLPRVQMAPRILIGDQEDIVPKEWLEWIQRWHSTSTTAKSTRNGRRIMLAKAGRWLAEAYPDCTAPNQWNRDISASFVAAVERMTLGQWLHPRSKVPIAKQAKALTPNGKSLIISAVRSFFTDCQEWQWLPISFNPQRSLASPRSIENLRGPNPRVIADDRWAKLLNAGLTLTIKDLPSHGRVMNNTSNKVGDLWYPFELVRAIVRVWLFAGLRSDEIFRLRVGCIRWQAPHEQNNQTTNDRICLIDIPTNKTSRAFSKPIDKSVGDAIEAWEKLRPKGPIQWDPKTGEGVDFLFTWRGRCVSKRYINLTIIPMLCQKAGIPEHDARGAITSHRARPTIATQLYNAPDPMSLAELQQWLGHSSPSSTQHYAKITPTKLARAYSDAEYFGRNVRLIEILVDQDAILSGAAAVGEPWRFYDVGHGYCTLDYFEQCAHRMACAKCSFYRPKESSYTQMLEAKTNLLRFQQSMKLTDDEVSAVEGDIAAFEALTSHLQDVPTPQGPTPHDLMPEIKKARK
jgi:integrase